jgi:Rieske 2Fe-2S family protein
MASTARSSARRTWPTCHGSTRRNTPSLRWRSGSGKGSFSDFLFSPETLGRPALDPADGVEIWDVTNRQDWHMCELAQQGVSSRAYRPGVYSKEESLLAAFDREYLRSMGA